MYNGVWSKAREDGELSRMFVLKVTLQSVKLLLTVSYRKKWGAGCITCSPNNCVVSHNGNHVPDPLATRHTTLGAIMLQTVGHGADVHVYTAYEKDPASNAESKI